MSLQISTYDERHVFLKHQLVDACKKFSKYFLGEPIIQCRISCSKNKYRVKIKLKAGGREFVSERMGVSSLPCINGVVDSILRMIETSGEISLLKGDKVKIEQIGLRCRQD